MEHGVFLLRGLLFHSPALGAEVLRLPIQELPNTEPTVLRLDSLELGAAVTVRALHQAATDRIPVLAIIFLPKLAKFHRVAV